MANVARIIFDCKHIGKFSRSAHNCYECASGVLRCRIVVKISRWTRRLSRNVRAETEGVPCCVNIRFRNPKSSCDM